MKKITFLLLLSLKVFSQGFLEYKISEKYESTLNNSQESWNAHQKIKYIYDSRGNVIREERESVDFNGVFYKDGIGHYEYDEKNRLISQYYEGKHSKESEFQSYERTTHKYDENDNIIEFFLYEKSNGSWELIDRTYITYDENGRVKNVKVEFKVDGSNDEWADDEERYVFSYNSEGNVEKVDFQIFENGIWVSEEKDNYKYNDSKKLIEHTHFIGVGSNSKKEYLYDANGNLKEELRYSFANNVWVKNEEINYKFDESKVLKDYNHPFKNLSWIGYESVKNYTFSNLLIEKSFKSQDSDKAPERVRYIYKEGSTASIKGNLAFDVNIYPNPTSDLITITNTNFDLKRVEIYNLLGKKMISTQASKFSIRELANGIYLLKVQSEDGKIATKRIVKN